MKHPARCFAHSRCSINNYNDYCKAVALGPSCLLSGSRGVQRLKPFA